MDSRVCVSAFHYRYPVLVFNVLRNIIRDNMLINMSRIDNQWMGVDMNIEHLINFLKVIILTAREQHIYLLNCRQFSLRKESMHLGIASAIYQLQATPYVPPKSTLAVS